MGWVGLIQIAEVGWCFVEAHFVPVSGVQNTGAGEAEEGRGDAGMLASHSPLPTFMKTPGLLRTRLHLWLHPLETRLGGLQL